MVLLFRILLTIFPIKKLIMFIDTRNRSTEEEMMDDFLMEGAMLQNTLDQLAVINKRLGGNLATIKGINTLLKKEKKDAVITIVDMGCGSGDMLRAVADYGKKNNFTFKLIGIDANEFTVNYARRLSENYTEISYIKMDILSSGFSGITFDIAITTLFLHHFTNQQIENLLVQIVNIVRIGVVVNDLHRSSTAYYLFKGLSFFIKNPMVKKDGAISVLRGFKKNELNAISKKLKDSVSTIHWKWAFRYQWIIKKL
jgi:2-polyprenyl-3-methyl-5-hydroxy-6-metoxy-1,4-benzoquinol methylase